MTLYHTKIGFPSTYRRPVGIHALRVTRHAAAREVEKGFKIPDHVNMSHVRVIEIEMRDNRLIKMVVRMPYDAFDDIVMAIGVDNRDWIVRTAWLNDSRDKHDTLDTSRYGRP